MNTQQHKHGERVFCWSQSMFGSGSKIWGTVRQCSKYKWVDLDNSVGSNQNRVRYDRAYWYSQDDWDLECQQIREIHENDKRKEEKEKIKATEKYQEVTANLIKLTEIKVGQKIRVVPKNCPDMHFVYIVTEIRNNTIFGLDSDDCEVSVGRVGEVYFAVKESIDNPVVETVKETNPQNKVAKLQAKLTRLNAQLLITRGNRAKVKIVIEILRVESVIERLNPRQKEITLTWEQKKSLNALTGGNLPVFSKLTEESKEKLLKIVDELEDLEREEYRDKCTGKGLWKRPSKASIKRSEKRSNEYSLLKKRIEQLELIQEKPVEINQSKPVDVPATKKNEFCKKPEKATIKFLESRFKDAQVDITETQVIIKSGTSELAMNLFFEIPDINDYYNQYRRAKTIKNLKQNQTSKVHSVCEYISAILLAS